ncbi:MAG: rhamnulokinase [Actinobacteria bacterium]|nr:rhamnulokinase [Actinomycetota bacterium]
MEQKKQYIAVDLGAESGRVMLGTVSAEKLSLEEIFRFANNPIKEDGHLKWDFDGLFSQIKTGIAKAIKQSDGEISGIGVDSWGVDFGLLDENGELIENPYHYRDSRTEGVMEKAFELMDKGDIYRNSGIQFMPINTVYQLLAMRLANSQALAKAKKLVFMADLVSRCLCGRAYAEYTLASTSQLMDMRTGQWSQAIFDKLALPLEIMPEVIKPGTIAGQLTPQICEELGCGPIRLIAVGSHDTADAVAAVPVNSNSWEYLSSGTWSLIGIETPQAIINDKSEKYSFTNEGGVEDTIRFLKNIVGLWILQECRRQWQREGTDLSYAELTSMAKDASPFAAYMDPDYGEFLSPGNMPEKINQYLTKTGQYKLDDKGQIVRLILESLAFKYREVIEAIEDTTSQRLDVLHIVGGGIKNELLCQFAANATGKKVIAGPVEATACGNILMQALACGQIGSLAQGRHLVGKSFELKKYHPEEPGIWSARHQEIKKQLGA